ncbi:GIY-YIG nuclease family protein [Bacteroides graminisolvens]|uniref:GIY-YIG domain-containing protein n=1 Tax=Bacteroides graminisolvens DSM 19988 = JCM 15093 TaxID=1121097 RepID=A0A069D6I1_9BACE|nr:GIY-YIG nuclease family protein [Bacteroides graminisolvens]GAK37945.1 hypothetical protein JCM15093_3235 [Bacteroides graminisolvens DSM 19988 = JCM 15093]
MDNFILLFDEIKDLAVEQLVTKIKESNKIKVKDIRLIDLLHDRRSLLGVYIFFDEKDIPIYVGKSSSRSILERLASHFDTRSNAFFNNFLRKITEKDKLNINDENLKDAYAKAINFNLVFLDYPSKELIVSIEKQLIKALNPIYNRRR